MAFGWVDQAGQVMAICREAVCIFKWMRHFKDLQIIEILGF